MNSESRKSKRYTDVTPVTLTLRKSTTNDVATGPFTGKIMDICSNGACLMMPQAFIDSCHVFQSAQEAGWLYVELPVQQRLDTAGMYLSAQPVWLNTLQNDNFLEKMMSVEFLENNNRTDTINLI